MRPNPPRDLTAIRSEFVDRQRALIRGYRTDADDAYVTDQAHTEFVEPGNPMCSRVVVSPHTPTPVPVGVHRAVGGLHDGPTPGDILAAALASCIDSTTRLIATRMDVRIEHLAVTVRAHVDVRGTLLVRNDVPVQFQRMEADVDLKLDDAVPAERRAALLQMVEHCCIVMRTLRDGVAVEIHDRS